MMLPKGTYFIGDPCYVIPDKQWKKYCRDVFGIDNSGVTPNPEEFLGVPIFQSGTRHGDGCYTDGFDDYGVDSGTIGATPKKLWDKKVSKYEMERLGRVITFKHSVEAYAEDGRFFIGDIEIDTN